METTATRNRIVSVESFRDVLNQAIVAAKASRPGPGARRGVTGIPRAESSGTEQLGNQ